ncbi:MAG: biopolymer transporter ExbD [Planctomycetia bacterium]|nr:biopolymer transporter ExbD [Planctomycetia bacterium]
MKRSSPFHTGTEGVSLQMTSMIDVIFLLLIFFAWTSNFQIPEQLMPSPLMTMLGNIPSSEEVEIPPDILDLGEIIIGFHFEKNPFWDIHGTRYDSLSAVTSVLNQLAQQSSEIPVIFDVDGNVPMMYVISIQDAARLAGFKHIQFAINDSPDNTPAPH